MRRVRGGVRAPYALGKEEKRETNLIFLLLQLSQARCVFVRFLASLCAVPGVEGAAERPASPVESV